MAGKIETIDQLMKQMSDIVLKLTPLIQGELFTYRTIQTQHGNLMEENMKVKKRNEEIEAEINKKVQAGIELENELKAKSAKNNADIVTLWARAHAKYKEIDKDLDEMSKKVIKRKLGELEKIATE